MNHTKGKWFSHDNGTYIELRSDCPDGELLSWTAIGDVCASKYSEVGDLGAENASRIVDCVNACDGMDDPSYEIAKLRSFVVMLSNSLESCAKELTSMIDAHNEQSMEDGSWKYDHQTPWEALHLIESMKVK